MKSAIETFKDIHGYEDYQVSDYGSVRSLKYGKVKYLKNNKLSTGYEQVGLYRDGKKQCFKVHRLVYEAFVGEISKGYEIDHINGVRDDNRLINLRVVTSKQNSNNPITHERMREANQRRSKDQKWIESHREANRKARNKAVLQLDKQTDEIIRKWECAADAWRELGINFRRISECCNNKLNSAGGFKWQFTSN